MKRLPAQKSFLQKAGYHGSGHKILGVNFGNSILNNNDSNKINDHINKKNHLWNRNRVRLIEKEKYFFAKTIVKYLSFQNTRKKKLRKEQTISSRMSKRLKFPST